MIEIDIRDTDLSEAQHFNDALTALLQAAHDSNIDVSGTWSCRNSASYPDWDITITGPEPPNPDRE